MAHYHYYYLFFRKYVLYLRVLQTSMIENSSSKNSCVGLYYTAEFLNERFFNTMEKNVEESDIL